MLSIREEKAHYLLSVLRCRTGDHFIAFDGSGTCFKAVIRETGKREIIAEVLETSFCNFESSLRIILVQGILKGEKMDMVIQKTTELGINEIIPAVTARSQLRDTRRVKRWRTIAQEASRQSGRSMVPVVCEPIELMPYLASCAPDAKLNGFIFYEEGGMSLKNTHRTIHASYGTHPLPHSLHMCIGPEGGFVKEEVQFAEESGFRVVSLGKRVLRAETAAIAAVALVQYLFGDMG
jgi:16S rRNA (uracil1498-N3)-methyltransferase